MSSSTGTRGSSSWARSRSSSARPVRLLLGVKNASAPATSVDARRDDAAVTSSHVVGLLEHVEAREPARDRRASCRRTHRSRRRIAASRPMPPTSANSSGREHRRPHLRVVAGQAPAARALRDPAQVQVGALQAVERRRSADTTGSSGLRHPPVRTTPATPAGATTGVSATGSHIILLPKLARSCSRKISSAGDQRADRGQRRQASARTGRARRCGAGGRARAAASRAQPSRRGVSRPQLRDLVAEDRRRDRRLVRLARAGTRSAKLLGLLVA